ncbi:MAG: diguanylate cyclase [Leptothrix sp. (in: b-proteobacteria)]
MFKRRFRQALLCVATLAASVAAAPAHAVDRVAVQLSWMHQFQFAGFYLAQARGFYRDAGIEVELRPGGLAAANAIDAVVAGRAEFGVANSGLSVARMKGRPVVALEAITQRSPRVWVSHQPVDTPEQIAAVARGRVAWDGSIDDAVELSLPLSRVGVRLTDLPKTQLSHPIDAFIRRQVDLLAVYRTNELAELRRRGLEFTVLDTRSEDGEFYGEVLFCAEGFAEANASLVKRFRDATLKGWQAAFDDIEGAAEMIRARYAPDRELQQLISEGQALERLSRRDDIQLGHLSPDRFRHIAMHQVDEGLASDARAMEGLVWNFEAAGQRVWPDPALIGLLAMVTAMFFAVVGLCRAQLRSHAELDTLKLAHQQTRDDDLRFQFLMDVAPFPVMMFGIHDGEVVYANERALGSLGLEEGQVKVHDAWPALVPGGPLMQRLQSSRIVREVELERPGRQGAPSHWALLTMRAVAFERKPCAFAAATDITARKRAEIELNLLSAQRGRIIDEVEQLQSRLREASVRDPLTGLFNRRYLDATLARELTRCQREGRPLSMLVVDADHFKRINDQYGHAGGDEVLRAIARAMQSAHRSDDVICRFGGEEFVIAMPAADAGQAALRAEALRLSVADLQIATDSGIARITVSIGVAQARDAEGADSLFKRADAAVYAAKATGRNRVVVASADTAAGFPKPDRDGHAAHGVDAQ